MSGFAPVAVRPAHQLTAGDDSRSDAGAQRDQQRIADAARRAGEVLAPRRARGVVVDPDGHAEPPVELVPDADAPKARQVGADAQDAGPVDQAGYADADGPDVLTRAAPEPTHDAGHGVEQRDLAVRRGDAGLVEDHGRVVGVEQDTEDLGAAHVDAGQQPAAGGTQ